MPVPKVSILERVDCNIIFIAIIICCHCHVVETSVTVNNSPLQAYTQPEDHNNYLCYDSWAPIISMCFIINYYYFVVSSCLMPVKWCNCCLRLRLRWKNWKQMIHRFVVYKQVTKHPYPAPPYCLAYPFVYLELSNSWTSQTVPLHPWTFKSL